MKYYKALTKDGRQWTPSYSVSVDRDKCSGCGLCVDVCSRNVYEMVHLGNRMVADNPRANDCVGDGSCSKVCPTGALN